ncbi:hypothetical protein FRB90_006139 [Tulasnella sp. 427]|nr:hypothetical protein FRB90_006139 [Tulasnella sp. 427]
MPASLSFRIEPASQQEEIEAILKLDHLEELPTPSIVQAANYSLLVGGSASDNYHSQYRVFFIAESKPWPYGTRRNFQPFVPAPRKWTFTFIPQEQDLIGTGPEVA